MKVNLQKGDYRYDALMAVWNFLKLYGEPEDNEKYWHDAIEFAKSNTPNDLAEELMLATLNYLDKRCKE